MKKSYLLFSILLFNFYLAIAHGEINYGDVSVDLPNGPKNTWLVGVALMKGFSTMPSSYVCLSDQICEHVMGVLAAALYKYANDMLINTNGGMVSIRPYGSQGSGFPVLIFSLTKLKEVLSSFFHSPDLRGHASHCGRINGGYRIILPIEVSWTL